MDQPTPNRSTPISRSERVLVACVVIGAAALRTVQLDRVPPAMNQDEVLRGYDAWSIWKTGADYRGVKWPAYLEAYGPGEYVAASSAYLTAPFVGLLGLEPWVVRLPFALAGTATIVLLWWWVRREAGAVAGVSAAAVLAVNPWHIQVSRMAFEGDLTPFLVTAGLAAVVRTSDTASRVGVIVGGIALGAAMWNYPAARLVVPLLLLAWAIIEWRRSVRDGVSLVELRRRWMLLAGAVMIGAGPMLATLIRHPGQLFARAENVGLFGADLAWSDGLGAFIRQYAAHFDPVRLFFQGEGRPHQYPPDVGFLHLYEAVPFAAGIVWTLWHVRRSALAQFLVVWLVLFPLPAALTRGGGPQMIRSIMGLPFVAIVVGLGVAYIVQLGCRWTHKLRLSLAVLAAGVVAANIGYYCNYYFRRYPAQAARAFNTELPAAFAWVREHGEPYDAGFVAFRANQPFAYYLFFTRFDPARAQAARVERVPWMIGFEVVVRYDRFFFCPPQLGRPMREEQLMDSAATLPSGARILVLAVPGQIRRTRPVAVVSGPDGGDVIEIHRWTSPGTSTNRGSNP